MFYIIVSTDNSLSEYEISESEFNQCIYDAQYTLDLAFEKIKEDDCGFSKVLIESFDDYMEWLDFYVCKKYRFNKSEKIDEK